MSLVGAVTADVIAASRLPDDAVRVVRLALGATYDASLAASVRHAAYGRTSTPPGWTADDELTWCADALRSAYTRAGWVLTFAGWTRADVARGSKLT